MCSTFCSHPPCLPHRPEESLIALCLSFLRTLHTDRMNGLKITHTTKRDEEEGEQQEGSRRLGTETCILSLSCQWRVLSEAAVQVGLQPLQDTWSLGLSFEGFLSYATIPKGGGKGNPLPHKEGWITWREKKKPKTNQLLGTPPSFLPSCPWNS